MSQKQPSKPPVVRRPLPIPGIDEHFNCRCSSVPLYVFEDCDGADLLARLSKKTRSQCYAQGRADGMREQSAEQSQRHRLDVDALQKQVDLLRGILLEVALGKGVAP